MWPRPGFERWTAGVTRAPFEIETDVDASPIRADTFQEIIIAPHLRVDRFRNNIDAPYLRVDKFSEIRDASHLLTRSLCPMTSAGPDAHRARAWQTPTGPVDETPQIRSPSL